MLKLSTIIISVLSATGAFGATAFAAKPTDKYASPQTGSPWIIEATEKECHLQRKFDSDDGILWLDIIKGGGPEQLDLLLSGPGVPKFRPGNYSWLSIKSRGNTRQYWAYFVTLRNDKGHILLAKDLSYWTFSNLQSDQILRVFSKSSDSVTLNFPINKNAFAKFDECYNNLLKSWGVNHEELALPAISPGESKSRDYGNQGTVTAQRSDMEKIPDDSGSWVSSSDWPREALLREMSGTTIAALTVDPSGRATACSIAVSSGHAPLDSRTCELLMSRARYQSSGSADESKSSRRAVERVRWVLPAP